MLRNEKSLFATRAGCWRQHSQTVGEHITGSTPYSLRSVMCTLGMCIVVHRGDMGWWWQIIACVNTKVARFPFHMRTYSICNTHFYVKSDNLQYNMLGRSSHLPSIWWSKYYVDRLKIEQWVAGLDLGHSKLFIFVKL